MRICPTCGNSYTDDANFCPMDASRLPPPAAAAPSAMPDTTLRDAARNVGGRFLLAGEEVGTPTGVITPATDTGSGAQVAVKVVTPAALPTQPMQDRALRELKQLGKVHSERVVKVLDQGRLDDGRVYVATEQVRGTSLEALVARNGPLSVERAAAIVLQVGEALTEAQKVGVIHRDVCPRNIFVGDADRVKVGDFGLAEPVTDKVFGAPAYLSPEQVEGRPVDQRSNIYSLGAVFHFALTGEPPFGGDAQSVLQAQLGSVPSPPSSRRQGLASEIDRVILKALEKSGGRRHLTLRQLLTEIEAASGVKAADAHKFAGQSAPAPARPSVDKGTVMGLPAMANSAPAAVDRMSSPKAASGARTMMALESQMPARVETPRAAPEQKTAIAEPPKTLETPMTFEGRPSGTGSPAAQGSPAPRPVEKAAPEQRTAIAEAPKVQPQAAPQRPAAQKQPQKGQPAAQGKGGKAGFRETAWFKQGEIDEELAKQAAAKASSNPLEATGTTGKHAQVNPDELSQQDHARLSLRTGATQANPIIKGSGSNKALGDRMSDDEMLAEIDSSRKYLLVAGVVVAVVVLLLVLWLTVFRSSPTAEAPPPDKPAAVAAAPPAAAVPTTPPPPTPAAPTAPTPKTTDGKALLAQAAAELRRDNLSAAVDLYVKAAAAGSNAKDLKKAEAPLVKAITSKITRAKKRKDKPAEAEARALLDRVNKKK